MPYYGCFSPPAEKKIGRPKRDRAKIKAARRAGRKH